MSGKDRYFPPVTVEVYRLGIWWPGECDGWVRFDDQWWGRCQWHEDADAYHVGLIRVGKIRGPIPLPVDR